MNSKKAEMGVGTLIIFISLLLVAAVAAGVLIQTAGSLQQRALSTGQAAQAEISSRAIILEVSGEDGSLGGVDTFMVLSRLAPGSNSMQLSDVILTLSSDNTSQSLQYGGVDPVVGNTTHFSVRYLQRGSDNSDGLFVRGDVIEIQFSAPRNFTSSESVRINFVPRVGMNSLVQFSLPNVISTQRVYLYP